MVSPRGRGRPKRTKLDLLRTQVWFRAVTSASGLSAYALEKKFSAARSGGDFQATSSWTKYGRGAATPSHIASGLGLVERVDSHYPGTGSWFHHVLWRALDPKPLYHEELRFLYEGLPSEIRAALLHPHPGNRFWRRPLPRNRYYLVTGDETTIDTAAAFACMARDAEISQDQETHLEALQSLQSCLRSLEKDPIMGVAALPLQALVASAWSGTIYFRKGSTYLLQFNPVAKCWQCQRR